MLGVTVPSKEPPVGVELINQSIQVPYDTSGNFSETEITTLNLSPGQKIYMKGGGRGRVVRYCSTQQAWELEIEGKKMLLGFWWISAAKRGGPEFLPVFNVDSNGGCHK